MPGHTPTHDEIWTQFGYVVELRNNLDLALNSNPSLVADQANVDLQVTEGEYIRGAADQALALIGTVAAPLASSALAAAFRPFLQEFMYLIGGVEGNVNADDETMFRVLRDYMVANAKTIKTRALTINAPTEGAADGDFTVRRLSTDKDAKTIESVNVETLRFTCINDQNNGGKEYEENFRVDGEPPYVNAAQWLGSGLVANLLAAHARSTSIIKNPSFDRNSGTDDTAFAAVTDCNDWTVTTAARWKFRSSDDSPTYIYRGYPGAPTTLWSIECITSDSISQVILDVNKGAQFKRHTPYFLRVAVMRKADATGNVTLTFGAVSVVVALNTLTTDQWYHLFIDLNEDCWFDNFNQDALDVVITVDTLAVGTVVFDDVVLAEMTNIGGHWYVIDGGDVPALVGDYWTSTISEGARGKNGYWLWRAFGAIAWLPASATPTNADPA